VIEGLGAWWWFSRHVTVVIDAGPIPVDFMLVNDRGYWSDYGTTPAKFQRRPRGDYWVAFRPNTPHETRQHRELGRGETGFFHYDFPTGRVELASNDAKTEARIEWQPAEVDLLIAPATEPPSRAARGRRSPESRAVR
jgi:hypothetical protein